MLQGEDSHATRTGTDIPGAAVAVDGTPARAGAVIGRGVDMAEQEKAAARAADAAVRRERDTLWTRLLRQGAVRRIALGKSLETILESRLTDRLGGTMGRSLRTSALVHATVIVLGVAAWPVAARDDAATLSVVPVNLVTIADDTAISATVRQPSRLPPSDLQQLPPAPSQPEPAVATKDVPQPMTPADALQAAVPEYDTEVTPRAVRRPTGGPPDALVGKADIKGADDSGAMTMSVRDALRNQIAHCWELPDSPSNAAVAMPFDLYLNRDGSISQPPSPGGAVPSQDIAFAESVRRAIYACAPYHLPSARFAEWHAVTLMFDSRQLIGAPGEATASGR